MEVDLGWPSILPDRMAGTTGLEPATSAVTGQRSNQLSYVPRKDLTRSSRSTFQEAATRHATSLSVSERRVSEPY
jgi:hypothetical protein